MMRNTATVVIKRSYGDKKYEALVTIGDKFNKYMERMVEGDTVEECENKAHLLIEIYRARQTPEKQFEVEI